MTEVDTHKIPEDVIQHLHHQYETLESEFAPDICNTLGDMAVKSDLVRAVILAHAEPWLVSELPTANIIIEKDLQATRDRIVAIDPDRRFDVSSKIFRKKVPQFLLNSLGVEYGHQVLERLVEQSPDSSYVVSDDVLLNQLQWHNYQMIAWREQFIEKRWPQLKEIYIYRLEKSIEEGWLPSCVLTPDRLKSLEQVEVIVDDGMLLHEKGCDAFVAYDTTAPAIEVYFPAYTFLETAYHELSHVMVGVQASKAKFRERFSGGKKTYGLYRLFSETHVNAGTVLDEAVTEHIASTMGESPRKDPDTIDPKIKSSLRSSYIVERELLDTLCNGGKKPIDIRLFMSAYFEDSTSMRQPAIKRLKRQLKKAFPGRDVLDELGELMAHGEYMEARKNLPQFTRSLWSVRGVASLANS